MIEIDKIEEGLPISVIVPLEKKREDFFYGYVLPLIEANEPKEIIINNNVGSAPKKRNDGFKKSTQPYVFFCDDDILLPSNLLSTFYNDLKNTNNNIGYIYCEYTGIVLNPDKHPLKNNFKLKSHDFDENKLKKMNYISTMSLFKREIFPFFDENIDRLQDWDLYLTLLNKNIIGKFNNKLNFYAFYLDDGITSMNNNINPSFNKIKEKHNI